MSVARVYAKALYETALGQQNGAKADLTKIEEQLAEFATMIESSKSVHMALCGPIATLKEKSAVLETLAKKVSASETVTRFLILLADNGRLAALREIQQAFAEVRVQSEGGVIGQLVVADPPDALSSQDVESLSRAFGKKLGKKVHFHVSSDPTLLAGMKVIVNGTTYDGSLRAQLQRLNDQLILSHPTA